MKSLLAVLALVIALGAALWKMQNPDGGLDDLSSQGGSTINRLKSGLAAVKSSGNNTAAATAEQLAEQEAINTRLAELESSVGGLAEAAKTSEEGIGPLEDRLKELEAHAADATDAETNQTLQAINQRMDEFEQSLTKTEAGQVSNNATNSSVPQPDQQMLDRLIELERRLDGLQMSLASGNEEFSKSINGISEQMGALDEKLRVAEAEATANNNSDELVSVVQNLNTRMDDYDSTLNELAESAKSSDGNTSTTLTAAAGVAGLAAMKNQLRAAERKISNVETSVLDLRAANEEQAASAAADPQELASLTQQLSDANGKIASLEKTVADLGETQTQNSAALAATRSTLESSSSGEAASSGPEVAALAAEIDGMKNRLGSFEASLASGAGANSSNPDDSATSLRLQEIETRLGSMSREIGNLGTQITASQQTESASIESQQNHLQAQLASLESKVSDTPSPSDIEAMSQALELSRQRIQQLESRVAKLPSASDEAEVAGKAQQELQSQIAALEERLATDAGKPNKELVSSLAVMRKKVSELENRPYVSPEELAKIQQGKSNEYKIYFNKNSTQITDAAGKVLKSFITQEKNRAKGVAIYGFTDRTGDANYNQRLAARRANNVRSYLIQAGFDFKKINAVDGIGEDLAAASSSDGQEDANQRFVVLYAFQP